MRSPRVPFPEDAGPGFGRLAGQTGPVVVVIVVRVVVVAVGAPGVVVVPTTAAQNPIAPLWPIPIEAPWLPQSWMFRDFGYKPTRRTFSA